MRKIKDVLRLKLDAQLSHERIAASLGISKGVVTKYVALAATAGLDWAQVQLLDESALQHLLVGAPQRASGFVAPDYGRMHQEMRRKGMTLMLLWEEHATQHPGQMIHSYSQFCENYRRYAKTDPALISWSYVEQGTRTLLFGGKVTHKTKSRLGAGATTRPDRTVR
jgi:hypothetical protein